MVTGKRLIVNMCDSLTVLVPMLLVGLCIMECSYCMGPFCSLSGCSLVADIGVWIDSSGSISRGEFENAKDVVSGIVTRFGVSEEGTHFSLGSFSDTVTYSQLDDTYDLTRVLDTLDNLDRLGGYTFTDLALETWGSKVFTATGGARTGMCVSWGSLH